MLCIVRRSAATSNLNMYLPPMEILVATTCTTNQSPSSSFCSTRKELHATIHSKSSDIDRVIPLTLPMLHIPHDRHRVIGRASSRGLSSQNHSPHALHPSNYLPSNNQKFIDFVLKNLKDLCLEGTLALELVKLIHINSRDSI
ncbi:hypothetical protein VIGAN_04051200 [Vigna angularis var. angularis]|uniref:Uncharacterized protein n=1 Tax=Vigna angularis var. angularis TaxID=157739 RepID=A0A0S3RS33_PHAAN|nr:hypothetical protein VIGAN_04051200 [Vigna angularis var. angularis]